jgi:hypothetical protein
MVIYGGPATLDGRRLEKITVKPDLSVEAEENAAIKMKIKE